MKNNYINSENKKQPVAIKVCNVHKQFKVYYDKSQSLKERILFRSRNKYEERWVLKGVDLQIKKGEAIGLIGENGCGKSTLLKLMCKIMYPDKGTIETKGRISSLIELGAGFHPDMTGKENIYTNASILGLKKDEIDRRLESIIRFSELEEYIDNPVRTYSSGMYMRLAFAVAINVDADILLIDEILAVGDANFQAKCFNRLREIKKSGTTIVIVSHSLSQIEQICDRSYWIEDGSIRLEGNPFDVHEEYLTFMGEKRRTREEKEHKGLKNKIETKGNALLRSGNKDVEIIEVELLDKNGDATYSFETGKPMTINIYYKENVPVENPVIGIGIFRNDGIQCYGTNTLLDKIGKIELKEEGIASFKVDNNYLLDGIYYLDIAVIAADGTDYDYYRKACEFSMSSSIKDVGITRLAHKWEIN